MPPFNTATTRNADQRLSQLIKLKRMEKPEAAFWDDFEREFRSRQLTTFVQIQPLHTRIRRAIQLAARKAAPPVAAVGAIGLTFLAVTNSRYLLSDASDSKQLSREQRHSSLGEKPTEAYFTVERETASPTQSIEAVDAKLYRFDANPESMATINRRSQTTLPASHRRGEIPEENAHPSGSNKSQF